MSPRPANFTRRTLDLPAKFRAEGRWHLIPIYHLLQLSDFGREGIAHSGSYRFADHLYRGKPTGRGWLGQFIDRILLNLPAARGMRARCTQATLEMKFALTRAESDGPFRILTVPCGIPRDVRQLVSDGRDASPRHPVRLANAMERADVSERHPYLTEDRSNARQEPRSSSVSFPNKQSAIAGSVLQDDGRRPPIQYTGMDIDPSVLDAARDFLAGSALQDSTLCEGNALDATTWPSGPFDFISSTGLGEFLTDEQLATFYGNVFQNLAPGGIFFTSATAREPRSDWLLRAFELDANYRSRPELEKILHHQPWHSLTFTRDTTGLQTFVRAVKAKGET